MPVPQDLLQRLNRLTAIRQDIECPTPIWINQLRKFASSLPESMLDRELDVLRSMSDLARLKILHLLSRARELCACEIQVAIGQSQPLTSHHLNALRKAGLVESRRTGTWVYYRISNDSIATVLSLLRDIAREDQAVLVKT